MPNRSYQDAGYSKYRWGFNGKEEDEDIADETTDFGGRLLNKKIGRWLSIDPKAIKYPSLSPYVFSNNNPILFVDFDGEDYGIYIDHENQTITIRAHYVVTSKDLESLQEAVNFWNKESGKYSYVVGEGLDATAYNIQFNVTYEIDDRRDFVSIFSSNPVYTKGEERVAEGSKNKFISPILNSYAVLEDALSITISYPDNSTNPPSTRSFGQKIFPDKDKIPQGGNTSGNRVRIKNGHRNDENTSGHELGHSLGLSHLHGLLMRDINGGGTSINSNHIGEMLGRYGIGDVELGHVGSEGKGTVFEKGQRPVGFGQGKFMETQKHINTQQKLLEKLLEIQKKHE